MVYFKELANIICRVSQRLETQKRIDEFKFKGSLLAEFPLLQGRSAFLI